MNQTPRYKLNQWDPADRILREDFNADNAKLETALGGLNTSVSKHDGQILGIPVLGWNLYKLVLQQKKAGQDVSWVEGLVYDDFADQSKIESLGTGMTWSPTEKRVIFSPVGGNLSAPLVTTFFTQDYNFRNVFFWIQYTISVHPTVEYRNYGKSTWQQFERLTTRSHVNDGSQDEDVVKGLYYMTSSQPIGAKFQLRVTLNAFNEVDYLPIKLYNYNCLFI